MIMPYYDHGIALLPMFHLHTRSQTRALLNIQRLRFVLDLRLDLLIDFRELAFAFLDRLEETPLPANSECPFSLY